MRALGHGDRRNYHRVECGRASVLQPGIALSGGPSTRAAAHLDNDPLKKASEHIGSRLVAAMGEVKAQRANVTNISKAKRSKNRRG
jgi:hypothetical protein